MNPFETVNHDNIVSMVFYEPLRIPIADRYRFTAKGDHNTKRRQKRYWKWLQKTGAIENAWGEQSIGRRVTFDQERLARKIILSAAFELAKHNNHAKTVYIGREEFSQLISDPEIWKYMPSHGLKLRPRELFGMEIRVVSHMKGILVV